MATVTSTGAGNWLAVMPGWVNGDNAVISHAVVVNTPVVCGSSPEDITTMVLSITTAGSLTVNPNISVTIRGNFSNNAGTNGLANYKRSLILNQGSIFQFDHSQCAVPTSRSWIWRIGPYCQVYSRGVPRNRAVIRVLPNMGTVYVDQIVYGRSSGHDWEFTDYIGFGSGYIKAGIFTSDISITPPTRFYYCNFDKCGALLFNAVSASSLSITFCNTTKSTYSGPNAIQLNGFINSSGTLECKFNSFSDTVLFNGPHSWEVENNYFAKSSPTITQGIATGTTGAGFKSYRRNYLGVTGEDSREIEGDLINCYLNSDLSRANYGSLNWLAWNAARTMQNCVLDNSDKTSAEGDFIMPSGNSTLKTAGTTHRYLNNILVPSAHGGSMGKPLSLYWGVTNVNIEIKNSTTVTYKNSDSPETALGLGELIDGSGDTDASIGHHVNEVVSFKNNLNWTPASKTPGWFAVRQQSPMQDLISASNVNYNWGWNLDAGSDGNGFHTWPSRRVNNQFSTGTPNPNGSYTAGDPQFVDSSRCFVSYDTHRLCNTAVTWVTATSYAVGDMVSAADSTMYANRPVNYRCLVAHVAGTTLRPGTGNVWRTCWEYASSYRLRENTHRVQDLIDWVRKGYSPRNTSVATYGEAGTFAGAVDPALTIELPPVINQFIAERITNDSVGIFASVINGSSNVSAYLLSLDSVTPLVSDSRWNSVLETTYNSAGVADSQLFLFAKDVNNLISFPQIANFAGLPAVVTYAPNIWGRIFRSRIFRSQPCK